MEEKRRTSRKLLCGSGHPKPEVPFVLRCDASDVAVGGVLCQALDGQERIVALFSKRLSSSQRNFGIYEKECHAIVLSLENFRIFVFGRPVFAFTDQDSLKWLMRQNAPKFFRLRERLINFDATISYVKGARNIADWLTRGSEEARAASSSSAKGEFSSKQTTAMAKQRRTHEGQIADRESATRAILGLQNSISGQKEPLDHEDSLPRHHSNPSKSVYATAAREPRGESRKVILSDQGNLNLATGEIS